MGRPGPNVIKICKICGQKFHPTSSRQVNCNRPIQVPCVICGKLMDRKCTEVPQKETCSEDCNIALIKQRQLESGKKLAAKVCKACGKKFYPRYVQESYCEGPHYSVCEVCGKQFEYDPRREPNKTCSDECRYVLAQQHTDKAAAVQHQRENLQAKYGEGVVNPMQIPGVLEKMKETNKHRYGSEWYTQTQSYRDNVKETSLTKYGVEHHLSSQEVIAKRNATVKEKYGVDNVFQNEDIKDKIKNSNLSKYGSEYATQHESVKDKTKQTNIKKYGANSYTASWEYRESIMVDPSKSENYKQFLSDPEDFISVHFDHKPNYAELKVLLGVSEHSIEVFLTNEDKLDLVEHNVFSYFENELVAILKDIKPDLEIQQHNRFLIKPYEIDVYLPEYGVGIEMNPTGTHNSTYSAYGNDPLPSNYHRMKTDLCEASGIHLFHIFGYEWAHKKNIIESMLRNLTGNNLERIYARKCEIRTVPGKDAFDFLQKNHRQGGVHSKIRLGLYYNNELVSLMTFGKMRNTMGLGNEDLSDCWELVRFCNKINTAVIGGASKLFTYFVRQYNPIRVRSFSDRAHTRGTLYQTLGFTEVSRSNENYVWVNTKDNKAYSRVNAQKHNLKKFFKDDTIDLTRTEKEIMEAHGYVQVFDSGTITWQWTCDSL